MSLDPDPIPMHAVTCSTCGRENAVGRQFCYFCRHALGVAAEGSLGVSEQPAPAEEAEQLQAALRAAQVENRGLRQRLQSSQVELDKLKAASHASV